MKLQWKQPAGVDHELIWGLIGLIAILTAVLAPADQILGRLGYQCGFRRVTGIPCPSCGATRAFVAAGSLRLGDAFRINPPAAALFLGLLAYVPYALVCVAFHTKRLRQSEVTRRAKWIILCAVMLLVLANWAYMILSQSRQA